MHGAMEVGEEKDSADVEEVAEEMEEEVEEEEDNRSGLTTLYTTTKSPLSNYASSAPFPPTRE